MANPNFQSTTTTDLTGGVPDYSVTSKITEGGYANEENKWTNVNASKYYGFYHGVGEYRAAIDAFATWSVGQGYKTLTEEDKIIFEQGLGGVGPRGATGSVDNLLPIGIH